MTTPPPGPENPSGRPVQPADEPQPSTAPQPVQKPEQAPLPPTTPQPVKSTGPKRSPSPSPGPPATPSSPKTSPPPGTPPKRVATGATRVIPSQPPPPTPRPGSAKPAASSPPSSGTPLPPGTPPEEGDESEAPWFRRYIRLPGVLIGLGILAASLLGSLVYYLFFRPEPVVLAAEVVVIPLPTPTFDVYIPPDPTAFVGGLPWSTMTYGLTAVEEMPLSTRTTWPERYAEAWLLTYTDGSDSIMTVEAYQHYYEDDAIAAFEALWSQAEASAQAAAPEPSPEPSPGPSPSASPAPLVERHPVTANGTQVGDSFTTTTEITETVEGDEGTDPIEVTREIGIVTWRNATAVFIMTADSAVVDDLFLEYGV